MYHESDTPWADSLDDWFNNNIHNLAETNDGRYLVINAPNAYHSFNIRIEAEWYAQSHFADGSYVIRLCDPEGKLPTARLCDSMPEKLALWSIGNKEEILMSHYGKFIVVADFEVKGSFIYAIDAWNLGVSKYGIGNFALVDCKALSAHERLS